MRVRAQHKTKRQLRNEILYLEADIERLELKILIRDNYSKAVERLLKKRDERIQHMTPEYRKSPYCAVHESIATRQQVKGKNGNYVWMEYCNYLTREECDVA